MAKRVTTVPGSVNRAGIFFVYTAFALVAFAGNSVLCRLALKEAAIDAVGFSAIRLVSGTVMLMLVVRVMDERASLKPAGNWVSATLLFLYVAAFSLAYVDLEAGTGALILFGSVQATMILSGLAYGERPHLLQWMGLTLALVGLLYLVAPDLSAPTFKGSILMVVAGVSWGLYSLRGRGTAHPLAETTGNFIRSVPLVAGLSLIMFWNIHFSTNGILLAALSGSVTSGLGYVIWYSALKGLTTIQAATVQLLVPVLAALGGLIFLSEGLTPRLLISAMMILGGIAQTVAGSRNL